jgi:hypothetical protein
LRKNFASLRFNMCRIRKHILFIVILSLSIFSCGRKQEEEDSVIPSYVLDQKQYVKLLVDMALSEAASNVNIKGVATQKYDSVYKFDPLKENKITKAKYDSTLAFYSRHPKMFKDLYDEVLTELSEMKSKREQEKKDTVIKDKVLK